MESLRNAATTLNPLRTPTSGAPTTTRGAAPAPDSPRRGAPTPPLPPPVSSGTRPAASSATATRRAAEVSVRSAEPTALDPLHSAAPTQFLGEWRVTPEALARRYGNLPSEREFGLVSVSLPTGQRYSVRDNQFVLKDGTIGLRLIPVGDRDEAGVFQGPGCTKADAFIRSATGLGEAVPGEIHVNPIYASIVFWHPEAHSAGSPSELAHKIMATEHRETHRGAYLGGGDTTNSPEEYHGRQWNVVGDDGEEGPGYPAHVFQIGLRGVDQGLYNWQGHLVDRVLNKGVEFPEVDYKHDIYRTVDLNTALLEYRDWILGASYLRDDESWRQYCAEHKELVEIIRANVPHNEASFREIFGDDPVTGGAAVWKQLTTEGGAFQQAFGQPWESKFETDFQPLWKREGLTADQIRPWKSVEEYKQYQTARLGGAEALAAYEAAGGLKPLAEGKAMLYRSESTSDLLHDFIAAYAPFSKVGGIGSAAAIMGFKDVAIERLQLGGGNAAQGNRIFLSTAMPVMQELLRHEALVAKAEARVPLAMWKKGAEQGLLTALSAGAPERAAAALSPLIKTMMARVDVDAIDQTEGMTREQAKVSLDATLAPVLEAARDLPPGNDRAIERNGPPGLITRTVQSPERHPVNPEVKIEYLFTAVHYKDLAEV